MNNSPYIPKLKVRFCEELILRAFQNVLASFCLLLDPMKILNFHFYEDEPNYHAKAHKSEVPL